MSDRTPRRSIWRVGALTGVVWAITASCNAISGIDALEARDCVGTECADASEGRDGGGGADAFVDGRSSDAASDGSADANADATRDADAVASDCGAQFYCPKTGSCQVDCRGCASNTLECPALATCLASCTSCPAAKVDCYTCPGPAQPFGTCAADPGACVHNPFVGCACNTAATCPGPTQVCIPLDNECQPCGAPSSGGHACTNGLFCNQATGTCP